MQATVLDKQKQQLVGKYTKRLTKKYTRPKSFINDDWVENKSTVIKVLSIMLTVFTIVITLFSTIMCLSTIISAYNRSAPTFFGFSTMQVSSGSMSAASITIDGKEYASGFEIGQQITVQSVDPQTLKKGDAIAFYVYSKNYINYHNVAKEEISVPEDTETRSKITFANFFGFQTNEIYQAASDGGMLTFHHITNIFRDANGKLWFKTQGSANASKDAWYVSEEMILGIYHNTSRGFAYSFVNLISSTWGFILVLLLPISLLSGSLIYSFVKDLQFALLELDVVEEKRKLTDDVCVRNNVGFRMDTKTKYKVLSQASEEDQPKYVSLLWNNANSVDAMQKYVKKRNHIIKLNKKLLDLNRECEKMFEEGKSIAEISTYYTEHKIEIQKERAKNKKRLKEAHIFVSQQKKEKGN